jgi:Fe-S cluster biogenesis protein NfuA
MTNTLTATDIAARMRRLDSLIQQVEGFADPSARAHTRELVQAILDLHAAGLERLCAHLAAAGGTGAALLNDLAGDDGVSHLLLLYGLHPADLETRVRQALESVRPYLRSHGGNVELLGIADGEVRLRLQGSCRSCPSSAVTMQATVEEAIYQRAPEVTAVAVEAATDQPAAAAATTFVPLEDLTMGLSQKKRRIDHDSEAAAGARACGGHH